MRLGHACRNSIQGWLLTSRPGVFEWGVVVRSFIVLGSSWAISCFVSGCLGRYSRRHSVFDVSVSLANMGVFSGSVSVGGYFCHCLRSGNMVAQVVFSEMKLSVVSAYAGLLSMAIRSAVSRLWRSSRLVLRGCEKHMVVSWVWVSVS